MLSYRKKAAFIKLLLLDVDGVLTDGGIYYSDYGENLKRFNTLAGASLISALFSASTFPVE